MTSTDAGYPRRSRASPSRPPAPTLLDAAHKRVGFVARHMMVSKVRGEFAEATATITVAEDPLESSVTATIQAASIDTGQADRDGHLRSRRLPRRREVPDAGVPQHRRQVATPATSSCSPAS